LSLGPRAQALDGIHQVLLLAQEGVAELLRPVELVIHHGEHLREEAELRRPPIIVLSANRGYDAEDLGVAAIVRKPFDVDALVGNITRVLGNTVEPSPATAPP